MTSSEQRDVISFLSSPRAYGVGVGPVERIDTHISIVWLVGDRVYKLKRAVHFDYVDFSTIELRHLSCEAEVRVNRLTAPSLYRGVVPVTRESDGSIALGGRGVPLDWLVEMTRFDQDTLFDRLAERGRLDIALMDGLADAIVRLHDGAEPRADRGGRDGMAWVIDGNARSFVEQGPNVLDPAACACLTADSRTALDRGAALLEARRSGGLVRWCHGDLHLRNICLIDGLPTLFDAIEFNESIACIDVLYDLAFLLMDLWRRDLRRHANRVFNEYIGRTGDLKGLSLLPLFLACRAAVRAKTSVAAAAVQPDDGKRGSLHEAARQYLTLAQELVSAGPASLIAVGGFSGTGKSTLARGLAPVVGPAPGALVLSSDMIRKRILGATTLTRLSPQGYAPEVTRQVYAAIVERAGIALKAGHAVIADAVHADPIEREAIAAVAREAGVPFIGLWIDGPPQLLAKRLRERVGDVSDATPDVLERQLRSPVGRLHWHRLDGSADAAEVQRRAEAYLR